MLEAAYELGHKDACALFSASHDVPEFPGPAMLCAVGARVRVRVGYVAPRGHIPPPPGDEGEIKSVGEKISVRFDGSSIHRNMRRGDLEFLTPMPGTPP